MCKKHLWDDWGLDCRLDRVGMAEMNMSNLMFPGVITVHAVVDMLKPSDHNQGVQITDVKDLSLEHVMVTRVSIIVGAICVEAALSGSTYSVAKHNIIAKVVRVTSAFSQEWDNIFTSSRTGSG